MSTFDPYFAPHPMPQVSLTAKVHPRTRELLTQITSRPLPKPGEFHNRLREIAESFLEDDRFVFPLWFGINSEAHVGTMRLRSDWDLVRLIEVYGQKAHDCGCVQASIFFMADAPPGRGKRARAALLVTATPALDLSIHEWDITLAPDASINRWATAKATRRGADFFRHFADLCPDHNSRIWTHEDSVTGKTVIHGLESVFHL